MNFSSWNQIDVSKVARVELAEPAMIGVTIRRIPLCFMRAVHAVATEKPPVFGMIQRFGEADTHCLDNVQLATIKPLILETVAVVTPDQHQ